MYRSLLLTAFMTQGLLFAQESRALFDAPMVVLPDDSAPFQHLFDCDGDGDLDAVGTRLFSNGTQFELQVWRNDSGVFVARDFYSGSWPNGWGRNLAIASGDFDRDGRQDFAVAGGNQVQIYTNSGSSFAPTTLAQPHRVAGLAAADCDGDGVLDLAWYDASNDRLVLHRGGGGGQVSVASVTARGTRARVEALQLDGDPEAELGVWSPAVSRLDGFDFVGGALVRQVLLITPVSNGYPTYWTSGDVDGDGDQDVVAFELPYSTRPGYVHCFRRTGAAAFLLEAPYVGGPAEFLGDVDGDGDLDGVCCGGGGGTTLSWPMLDFGSYFQIAINDGQGVFAEAFGFPGKGSSRLAGVSDVDGDGDADLVAGACVYYGRGPLRAAPTPATGLETPWFDPANHARALRDLDRDGDVDFVPALGDMIVNRADGSFERVTAPTPNPVLPAGYSAGEPQFVGDFDGDGAPDVVAPLLQGAAFSHMGRFRNNGSGHWRYDGAAAAAGLQIGWSVPYGDPRRGAYTDDLDGDGDVDLIATSDPGYSPTARTEIYWNQGQGTFVAGPVFTSERYQASADFDGDGRRDLLLCTQYPGVLQLHLATGNPATPYGPALPLPGSTPALLLDDVTVTDANDDGRPDFLVRHYDSAAGLQTRAHLWCNTTTAPGAPSFSLAQLGLNPLNYRSHVFAMDVDGDGMTDLVLAWLDAAPFAMQILRRNGGNGAVLTAAHFDPPVAQVLSDGWPVDVDGDGDLDLVGSHVVRNVRFHGTAGGAMHQYGPGTVGEAGIAPVLGATGPARVVGTKLLRLSGVTGPTPAILALGVRGALLPGFPLPSVTCLVDPANLATALWPITSSGQGRAAATSTLPIHLPAGIQGLQFFEQAFVLDPAAANGVSASNGLRVTIGG